VVATRGHGGDIEALASLLGKGLRFVGLLGSTAKLVHVAAALEKRGVPLAEIGTVRCPVGLAIGARTPDEIAISIMAEIVAVRRGVDPTTAGSMKVDLPGRLASAGGGSR
jgi:xanthine dehydrogenase accessory factor